MIYIVEGMDLAGKSTIAKLLAEKMGFALLESDRQFTKVDFEHDPAAWENVMCGDFEANLPIFAAFDRFVKVRFHLSQEAYSLFFNRKTSIKFDQVDQFLVSLGKEMSLIYLQLPYEIYKERLSVRGDHRPLTKVEFYAQSIHFLSAFFKSEIRQKIIVDGSKPTNEILTFLENEGF